MNWRFAIPLAAFAALVVLFGIGLWKDAPREAALDAPRALPAFNLPPVREGEAGFAKVDLGGEVALVNIFASWCPSCAVEQPLLMRLSAEKAARIYGVAWVDGPGKAAAWLDRHGDPYVRKGEDASGTLGAELGVTGAPETFVIDKQGRVRHRYVGPITEEAWATTLQPMLAQLEAEGAPTN
jgi:cytochrome c biogenesis protein CcmG/thiol:disulfide interchange protein DsbE